MNNHTKKRALATMAAGLTLAATTVASASAAHADDYYRGGALKNFSSGLCLDDSGQGGAGSPVIQWECNYDGNQYWYESTDRYGRPTLRNALNDLCLDINQGGGAGTGLILWYCNDGNNQVWSFHGDNTLVNTPSGLAVDNPGGSGSWGRQMIAWYWNGNSNQRWDDGSRLVLD